MEEDEMSILIREFQKCQVAIDTLWRQKDSFITKKESKDFCSLLYKYENALEKSKKELHEFYGHRLKYCPRDFKYFPYSFNKVES